MKLHSTQRLFDAQQQGVGDPELRAPPKVSRTSTSETAAPGHLEVEFTDIDYIDVSF
ncbi:MULTISPECIES: hypothetical protein [unclassified Streptomyces]|uniref:hypothetical protein n=1 Tax=unclassified Streptomyces TaxID=2593676 RepID=UPI00214ADEA3|nr:MULTISPECIES: hypothetical protein [unclassified Streptomyces]MCX5613324.1 hypothetical protein [Streptomyces sp. NBC_00047]UUU37757.1 hypothetical protein JIW86_01865 [Streptomyces sp. NBC_00162]